MPGRVTLAGSERADLPGARRLGPVAPDERISFSVVLAPRDATAAADRHEAATHGDHAQRAYVSPDDVASVFGADPDAVARVVAFADAHGLHVDEANAAQRTVRMSGRVADVCAAFETAVERFEYEGTVFRGRVGPLTIPDDLAGIVTGVFGIDDRPVSQHTAAAAAPGSRSNLLTPLQVAAAYAFPPFDGSGQSIGIVEFGGGYRASDLSAYATHMGTAAPQPVDVAVDGAANAPQPAPADAAMFDIDLEVAMDVEIAATLAPGARIVVYFAPNTTQGWHDALATALTDTQNRPSVLSVSWGAVENSHFFSAAVMQDISALLAQAAQMGVTVVFSSGDFGSAAERGDGLAHVLYPASDPNALACGGTVLSVDASGAIEREVVWHDGDNASGGGISDVFEVPPYQAGASIPPSCNPDARVGRGVPDVAGHADCYPIVLRGAATTARGTSAVAPLWAALVARINQALGRRAGLLNSVLYALDPAAFNALASGGNGGYSAGDGWDACTGLGTPNGARILAAMQSPQRVAPTAR